LISIVKKIGTNKIDNVGEFVIFMFLLRFDF
jgi:hypothetical protein